MPLIYLMLAFKNKKSVVVVLLLVTLLITSVSLMSFIKNRQIEQEQSIADLIAANEKNFRKKIGRNFMYGLRVDPYTVEEKLIGKGQMLADILAPFGISFNDAYKLSNLAKPFFNVRQLAFGKPYRVIYDEQTTGKSLKYLIYEQSSIDYVIFDFTSAEPTVRQGYKEMKIVRREAGGRVSSTLFGSMTENNLSAETAVALAEVFASSIDFHKVHPGDYYKVIFDEKLVDGDAVGVEKIIACQFNHNSENYFGFRYETDGKVGYYDEKGYSLRKSFLKSPLKFGRLTSGYTKRRFHPVQKRFKAHLGTDYAAPKGTPILSVADGVVIEARYSAFNGNYVKIRHNDKVETQYLHMSKFASGIRPGKRVEMAQTIGYVGSTGLSTGPHVCFRFWKNGKQVNHLNEKFAKITTLTGQARKTFEVEKEGLIEALNNISTGETTQGEE